MDVQLPTWCGFISIRSPRVVYISITDPVNVYEHKIHNGSSKILSVKSQTSLGSRVVLRSGVYQTVRPGETVSIRTEPEMDDRYEGEICGLIVHVREQIAGTSNSRAFKGYALRTMKFEYLLKFGSTTGGKKGVDVGASTKKTGPKHSTGPLKCPQCDSGNLTSGGFDSPAFINHVCGHLKKNTMKESGILLTCENCCATQLHPIKPADSPCCSLPSHRVFLAKSYTDENGKKNIAFLPQERVGEAKKLYFVSAMDFDPEDDDVSMKKEDGEGEKKGTDDGRKENGYDDGRKKDEEGNGQDDDEHPPILNI